MSKKKRLHWILIGILAIVAGQLLLDHFPREERAMREAVRHAVIAHYPDAARAAAARYGLRPYLPEQPPSRYRPVVLIHGLDDPGKVWMNLAPALTEAGFDVRILTYPNDQPITDSALLLHRELAALYLHGVTELDIVAHSMGGLVARDLLSRSHGNPPGERPKVNRLIMVGTPNHGSELARFRVFAELRDQASALVNGNLAWLGWIFDGTGEAGLDLLPGSLFLQTLNARPPIDATELSVIAAVLSQIDQAGFAQALASYRDTIPQDAQASIATLPALIDKLLQGIGDGLVTVESTRLPDAQFYLVEGTHLSMIRNVRADSDRIPPAVPIILQILRQQ